MYTAPTLDLQSARERERERERERGRERERERERGAGTPSSCESVTSREHVTMAVISLPSPADQNLVNRQLHVPWEVPIAREPHLHSLTTHACAG